MAIGNTNTKLLLPEAAPRRKGTFASHMIPCSHILDSKSLGLEPSLHCKVPLPNLLSHLAIYSGIALQKTRETKREPKNKPNGNLQERQTLTLTLA
jgi:hypothetical protein